MYFRDPLGALSADEKRRAVAEERILGGEAAMWTEVTSAAAAEAKIFPRASAYGARLWNYGAPGPGSAAAGPSPGWVDAELRLAAHADRLLERGVRADQIVPQFCQDAPRLCFPM